MAIFPIETEFQNVFEGNEFHTGCSIYKWSIFRIGSRPITFSKKLDVSIFPSKITWTSWIHGQPSLVYVSNANMNM